mmetsp:Transcript_20429/g.37981  ORF Transcript_20429/g.37981 Transcript_20429/m.37981 type:complete len:183 (-) Transcript_20429:53-601(-)
MFRKFSANESVSGKTSLKSSAHRGLLEDIGAQYPNLDPEVLEEVLSKKEQPTLVKCQNHVNLLMMSHNKEPLFFNQREGPFYPTLRLLHRAGSFMEKITVDIGAVKPLITGAELMCPGILKDGLGDFPANTPVQIMAVGKTLPFAIGITKMSSEDIRETNNGVGVEILHTLGDGLWSTLDLS